MNTPTHADPSCRPASVPTHRSAVRSLLAAAVVGAFGSARGTAAEAPPKPEPFGRFVPSPKQPDPMRPYDAPARTDIRGTATGFFHVEKIDAVWWLIDPNGYAQWWTGVNGPGALGGLDGAGGAMNELGRSVMKAYGGVAPYLDAMAAYWRENGFIGSGQWSFDPAVGPGSNVRYILTDDAFQEWKFDAADEWKLAWANDGWHAPSNAWHPRWESFVDRLVANQVEPLKDSPWIVGWFLGNERHFFSAIATWERVHANPADHPAKKAQVAFLRDRAAQGEDGQTPLARVNREFGTAFGSWEEMEAHVGPFSPATPAGAALVDGFFEATLERYIGTMARAVRRHDPNHLILGMRNHHHAHHNALPDAYWRIEGKYCDVVSLNHYALGDVEDGVPAAYLGHWERISRLTGRPLLISEWSQTGPGHLQDAKSMVLSQPERATMVAAMQRAFAQSPAIIGSQFFCVQDWGDALSPEGGGANYGLFDRNWKPYLETAAAFKQVNAEVDGIHRTGTGAKLFLDVAGKRPAMGKLTRADETRTRFVSGKLGIEIADGVPAGADYHARGARLKLEWEGVPLGYWSPTHHQRAPEQRWVRPQRVTVTDVWRNDDWTRLDLTFTHDGTASGADAAGGTVDVCVPHSAAWQVAIPKEGGFFLTKFLSLRNDGDRGFYSDCVWNALTPLIGGSQDGDILAEESDRPADFAYLFHDREAGLVLASTAPEWRQYMPAAWRWDGGKGGVCNNSNEPLFRFLAPGTTVLPPNDFANPTVIHAAFPTPESGRPRDGMRELHRKLAAQYTENAEDRAPAWSPIDCPERIEDLPRAYPDTEDPPPADWSTGVDGWRVVRGDQQAKAEIAAGNGPNGPELEISYRFSGTMGHFDYIEIETGGVQVPRPGLGFSFLVRLNGHKPMGMCVRAVDAGGETWQQDVACQPEGDLLRCVAVFDRWPGGVWGGDGNRRIDYPLEVRSLIIERQRYGDDSSGTIQIARPRWVQRPAPALRLEVADIRLGNLYTEGEEVRLRASGAGTRIRWDLADFAGTVVAQGEGPAENTEVGVPAPGPGWYRLAFELEKGDGTETRDFRFAVLHPDQGRLASGKVGVNTHFGEHWWAPLDVMDLLPKYGVRHIRDQFSWNEVEVEKGKPEITAHHRRVAERVRATGLQALMIACYLNPNYSNGGYPADGESLDAFGTYAARMAEAFPDALSAIEVWNEYYGGIGVDPGKHGERSPAQYAAMLSAVRAHVKELNPELQVMGLGGEWHQFIGNAEQMMAAEPAAYDGITIHPYHVSGLLEDADDPERVSIAHVARDFIEAAGRQRVTGPLWATEYGYSNDQLVSKRDCSVWTETEQAIHDVIATALLHAAGTARVYKYEFLDQSVEPMTLKFGMVLPVGYNCAPKPTAVAMATYMRMTEGRGRAEYVRVGDLHGVRFPHAEPEGEDLWLLWTTGEPRVLNLQGTVTGQTSLVGAELPPSREVSVSTTPRYVRGRALAIR